MSRGRRFPRPLAFGVLVLALGVRELAGQTTGSVAGRVVDSSGASLPAVTVEATSPSLQGTRTAMTSASGAYRFPALPPGTYFVRASLPGFRVAEKDATVRLDATATADFTLEPAATEQVVVSSEAPLIDSNATTTGTNYTSSVINHLPVARNYADIVKSNPGVSTDVGAGFPPDGFGPQKSPPRGADGIGEVCNADGEAPGVFVRFAQGAERKRAGRTGPDLEERLLSEAAGVVRSSRRISRHRCSLP